MKTVIIYESTYGNTRQVADEMATVLRRAGEVTLVAAAEADAESVEGANLVIVGGPNSNDSTSSPTTRHSAYEAGGMTPTLTLERDPEATAIRDWFHSVEHVSGVAAAAFDTRIDAHPTQADRASTSISRNLRAHGFHEVVRPRSFLVNHESDFVTDRDGHATRRANQILDALRS